MQRHEVSGEFILELSRMCVRESKNTRLLSRSENFWLLKKVHFLPYACKGCRSGEALEVSRRTLFKKRPELSTFRQAQTASRL